MTGHQETAGASSGKFSGMPVSPFYFLLFVGLAELVVYRFFSHIGVFAGVGAEGGLARLADVSVFTMILTGTLAAILLFIAMTRLVQNPRMPGLWWRILLIFVTPAILLTILWSIWMPLPPRILAMAIVSTLLFLALLVTVVWRTPFPRMFRSFFTILCALLAMASAAWLVLDYMETPRQAPGGARALDFFRVAEALALIVPLPAFVTLAFEPRTGVSSLWKPFTHLPALFAAGFTTGFAALAILLVQMAGDNPSMGEASGHFIRVAYRTTGFTLAFPGAIYVGLAAIFIVVWATGAAVLPRWKVSLDNGRREIGFGLAFVCLAGLQPVSPYLYALMLLGLLTILTGAAQRYLPPAQAPDERTDHRDTGSTDHREAD